MLYKHGESDQLALEAEIGFCKSEGDISAYEQGGNNIMSTLCVLLT